MSRARIAGLGCAALTVLVASLVLLGWRVGNQTLTSLVPRMTSMNPLTAVCFLGSAVALAVWQPGAVGLRRAVAVVLALAIASCGAARLSGYLFDTALTFDQLLFAAPIDPGSGLPSRIAPNTALNFLLLGLAIGLLVARRVRAAQLCITAVMLTSFVALMGYTYSVTSLVRVATFIPMALHTAILFLVMSLAALCATPTLGLIAAVTKRSAGGRAIRRMMPTMLLMPTLLGWLRLQGELEGLYNASAGTAFLIGAVIVMGLAMTWRTAQAVDREEAERHRADAIMLRLAYYDNLTGLPNRLLFEDRVRQALARANRSGDEVALLFLDLDGFKRVNDELGHLAGDLVLQETARRIEGAMRAVDTASRRGGDEFTIVIEQVQALEHVSVVAERLLLQLGRPFLIAGEEVRLSASIGVSLFPSDGRDPDQLVSLADAAMYRAKGGGKNQVAFHTAALTCGHHRTAARSDRQSAAKQ